MDDSNYIQSDDFNINIIEQTLSEKDKVYRNTGSSTGNLVVHLRDVHQIIDEDNENALKRHIQKQREESVLKWMLLTDQPLAAITNPAYKEKMSHFDPSFVVPGEQKIKTMIVKSYQHNYENLKNILNETAATVVSLTTDLWSSRAKHGYIGIMAAWITPNFKVKDVMLEI
ncbi:20810_t:CDS:2, partial [Rhizophagus irregularis]